MPLSQTVSVTTLFLLFYWFYALNLNFQFWFTFVENYTMLLMEEKLQTSPLLINTLLLWAFLFWENFSGFSSEENLWNEPVRKIQGLKLIAILLAWLTFPLRNALFLLQKNCCCVFGALLSLSEKVITGGNAWNESGEKKQRSPWKGWKLLFSC